MGGGLRLEVLGAVALVVGTSGCLEGEGAGLDLGVAFLGGMVVEGGGTLLYLRAGGGGCEWKEKLVFANVIFDRVPDRDRRPQSAD